MPNQNVPPNAPLPPSKVITLLGYYGFNNLGDDLLLQAALTALQTQAVEGANPVVQVLSQNPTGTQQAYTGVAQVYHRMRPWALLTALRHSQWLVLGGGGLFQDATSLKNTVYYAGVVLLARLMGNRVLWWAQGIGPLTHPLSQWLTAMALRASHGVSVRDENSVRWVAKLCPGKSCLLVPDPVWLLTPNSQPSALPASYMGGVGVSLREWPTLTPDGIQQLAHILHTQLPPGVPVVLLPFQPMQDEPPLSMLQTALPPERPVVWGNCHIAQVQQTMAGLHSVVAMRFHAMVLAVQAHKPVVAICYDPKVTQLAQQLELPCHPPSALAGLSQLVWQTAQSQALAAQQQACQQTAAVFKTHGLV
jgi:polysaccharide pyruvyl transferase CsaB